MIFSYFDDNLSNVQFDYTKNTKQRNWLGKSLAIGKFSNLKLNNI